MSGACGGAANAEQCVTEARPGLQWFLWDTSGQPTDATIHIHPMRAFVDSECQLERFTGGGAHVPSAGGISTLVKCRVYLFTPFNGLPSAWISASG
jgi:hypothetical protein